MHEIRIARDLSEIVLEAAGKENLLKVTKVSITFGRMVQIVPDIFDFAFREAVRDTIASEAVMDIEVEEVKMRCRNCGNDFQLADNRFLCTVCHSPDIDLIHGNELYIKSIEGEK
jgi:hydrogenase nickel incorporation protein HypA/HybF